MTQPHLLCHSLLLITMSDETRTGHRHFHVPDISDTLETSGQYMYHQFNIKQFYVLPTHCIYVFCVDLRTNSDYFTIQH
jgi:hypothetical protein